MSYLLDNPLLAWELRRLRGDRKSWLGAAGFAVLYYGLIAFAVAIWFASWSPSLRNLLTTFHYLTWGVAGVLLLLWAPVRMAQALAREKERGGLDALRLTGLSGLALATASLVSALTFPLALALITVPVALLGFGGDVALAGVARAYLALFLLAPVYTLAGGLAGLATRKAQQASSAAGLLAIALLIASGLSLNVPTFQPLALLGPWAVGLTAPRGRLFELPLVGAGAVPADLLQIPLLLLLGRVLLGGLARRLAGVPALLLGWRSAAVALAGAATVAALTFNTERWHATFAWNRPRPEEELLARLIVLWAALLLCAVEAPVAWRDLVRGFARRGPDDPVQPDERLAAWRFLAGPAVFAGWVGVLALLLAVAIPSAPIDRLMIGAAIVLSSVALTASAVQAAVLLARGRPLAWLLGAGVVVAFWFLPLVAGGALSAAGMPALLSELPQAINPLYGLALACLERGPGASGLGATTLATTCIGWQLAAAGGCAALARAALASARERADSLVALPADAFAPPGALDRRCPAGHAFASVWATCPHCPASEDAASSVSGAPSLVAPSDPEPPPGVPLAT